MRVEAASSPGQQRAFQLGTERPWLRVTFSENFTPPTPEMMLSADPRLDPRLLKCYPVRDSPKKPVMDLMRFLYL